MGIKFADEVYKEIDSRGILSAPEEGFSGHEFENWLIESRLEDFEHNMIFKSMDFKMKKNYSWSISTYINVNNFITKHQYRVSTHPIDIDNPDNMEDILVYG